jgi:hypothetical protein
LGLLEAQDGHPISVREIVCCGYRLNVISLLADIVTYHPLARTGPRLAVAKMQSRLEGAVVRFASRGESASGRAALK